MAKKDNQKIKSGFGVESLPVGLFPAGSIVGVSGNKVITNDNHEFGSTQIDMTIGKKTTDGVGED